jgi:hypothetical protein
MYAHRHMHDGGTHVDLYINDKLSCSSLMFYNARPGYGTAIVPREQQGLAGQAKYAMSSTQDQPHAGHALFGGKHISDPGMCTSWGRVEQGDKMRVTAYYDTKNFGAMSHKGKVEEQMGILRVYVGPDDAEPDAATPAVEPPSVAEGEGQDDDTDKRH